MNKSIDRADLRQAAAALDRVLRAGRIEELKEHISWDWAAARERRMAQSIGYPMQLAGDLRGILKADDESCRMAVDDVLTPSYSRVALSTLLEFAEQLNQPLKLNPPAQSRAPERKRGLVA